MFGVCAYVQRGKLYRPIARWVSILTVDIPSLVIGAICYTWIIVLMVKPMGDHDIYYALVVLSTLISFGFAYLSVEITRSVEMATVLYGMNIALSIWFAGFSQKRPNMLHWLRWGCDVDYIYYTIGQLMVNEFRHYNADTKSGDQGEKILDYYSYDNLNRRECFNNLFVTLGVVLGAVLVAVCVPFYTSQVQIETDTKRVVSGGRGAAATLRGENIDYDSEQCVSPLDASLLRNSSCSSEEEGEGGLMSQHSQRADIPNHLLPDISLR